MAEAVKNSGYTQTVTFEDGSSEMTRGIIGVVSLFCRLDLQTPASDITRITLDLDNQEEFVIRVYHTLQRDYSHLFVLKCPRFPGGYVNPDGGMSKSEQGVKEHMVDNQLLSTITSECYQLPHLTPFCSNNHMILYSDAMNSMMTINSILIEGLSIPIESVVPLGNRAPCLLTKYGIQYENVGVAPCIYSHATAYYCTYSTIALYHSTTIH